MSTFQQVILVGNLGNDPITKHFDGGGQLTTISIATTEYWVDKTSGEKKELTEWHRVTLNGKLSELADKYLKKGSKVLINGKLKTRKYLDNANVERYTTEIVAREMTFMSSANSQGSQNNESAVDAYKERNKPQPHAGDEFLNTDFAKSGEEEHDDLPF